METNDSFATGSTSDSTKDVIFDGRERANKKMVFAGRY